MDGSSCAFLDASVLYPVTLRNLLMRLTLNGLFQARWSKHVHDEWIRAVLRDRPDIPTERLHAVRDAMDEHAEDSLVTGYEGLIEALHPDEFVRHLLDLAPALVIDALRDQQTALTRPPMSMDEMLSLLERIGLVEAVGELRRLMEGKWGG